MRGYWCITKYDDIVNISKNPKTFSSYHGTNIEDYSPEDMEAVRMLMVNMDPPQHNKFRKLASVAFTPRVVNKLEPRIRELTAKILDQVAEKKDVDIVAEMAGELPLQVICELGGVPHDERHLVFNWSNRLIGFDDPEFQTTLRRRANGRRRGVGYANSLAEGRKGKTGDDLVTLLVNAEVDGTQAHRDGVRRLLPHARWSPATRPRETSSPAACWRCSRIPPSTSASPEILRSSPPPSKRCCAGSPRSCISAARRRRDVEIRGTKIKQGEKVVMYYPSANRDEDVFPDPFKFDVGRTPNEHLAFGTGQHFCLGASLARLEIRVMFEELIRRLPKFELTGKPRRLRSNFINGYKEIPVRFTPARA